MASHEIPYCIYIDAEGKRTDIGSPNGLESPDFPKTLFYDSASENSMLEYLEANSQPRMISQGNVRSILGTIEKDMFALFMNSEMDVIEHHKFARGIHALIQGSARNET